MKFQKTIDAIQFFKKDYPHLSEFILEHSIQDKADLCVSLTTKITRLDEVSVKLPIQDNVILRIYPPVVGYEYFTQGDWLIVDRGKVVRMSDSEFKEQGWLSRSSSL